MSESLLRRVFKKDKEVGWVTVKVLWEQSVIVDQLRFQRGQVRVIRVIKRFLGNSGRVQERAYGARVGVERVYGS